MIKFRSTHPSINGQVKDHQRYKWEQIVHEKVHPMDIYDDVIFVTPQFGWSDTVNGDIVFPMCFYVDVNLPESEIKSKRSQFSSP